MKAFLSYSSSEHALAERIAYSLRDEGHSVFFDRASLPPGEGYDTRIREAIEDCDLFIYLITAASVSQGSYALAELAIAKHRWASPSGRVLPVLVSAVDLDALPPYLNAVTVLRPQGDLVPEVLAVVSRLDRRRKRARWYWAFAFCLAVFAVSAGWFRWAKESPVPSPPPVAVPRGRTDPLPPPSAAAKSEPVKIVSSLSNTSWTLNFDILSQNPIKEIFVRTANEETFTSTGFTNFRDPRTGLERPKAYVEVPLFKDRRTLFVKYTDATGHEYGPYALVLDPVKQIVAETKSIFEATAGSWVSFRESSKGGRLVYFTHLVSHKNGLKEIQYSIDNESLSRRVRFTADWSGPGLPPIRNDDETMVEVPLSAKFVYVKVVFIDGSEWPARKIAIAGTQ